MKKTLFILFVFSVLMATAQNRNTVETRALTKEWKQAKGVVSMPQRLLDRYPIRKDKSGVATIGVIAKVSNSFDVASVETRGMKVTSRVASIVVMRVPLNKLAELDAVAGIETYSVAHTVAPMMDRAKVDTRSDSVHEGFGLPMPFDGEGVLIGITDWGFDYTHPNINRRTDPRIEATWDHFRLSGPSPEGFDYGTEYNTSDDIFAAKGDTSGLYGYGTHGTHVAGICGGHGTSSGHCVGQAPQAHYLLGSWFLDEASWLDQVAWMKQKAKAAGKRLVINSSWGMYNFSTLDGSSLLDEALNAYADSGIVFVTSAGNNGENKFHLQALFESDDTLRSVASYLSSGVGQSLIYWGEPTNDNAGTNQFKAAFAMVNKSTSVVSYSPFFNTMNDIDYLDSAIVTAEGDTVGFDIMVEHSNALDSRPHVIMNVDRNDKYRLIMVCTADSGVKVNIWNVGNVRNNAGNTGCSFATYGPLHCVEGDNWYGISEPGCAAKNITVAAHVSDFYNGDDYIEGSSAPFSSCGPTIDGRNKPEISAPGYGVVSSLSSWRDDRSYQIVHSDISGGRKYEWAGMSGTSMSSPNVTGIVAMMLQANPQITVDQIREILFTTARNDSKTGPLQQLDSISPRWGYGKVNALRAVGAAYDLLSIEQAATSTPRLVVFPSPANSELTILTGSNAPREMEIFSIDGRCLLRHQVAGQKNVDIRALPKGIYVVRVQDPTGIRTAKFIK